MSIARIACRIVVKHLRPSACRKQRLMFHWLGLKAICTSSSGCTGWRLLCAGSYHLYVMPCWQPVENAEAPLAAPTPAVPAASPEAAKPEAPPAVPVPAPEEEGGVHGLSALLYQPLHGLSATGRD